MKSLRRNTTGTKTSFIGNTDGSILILLMRKIQALYIAISSRLIVLIIIFYICVNMNYLKKKN